jgi:hypothetical protein
LQALVFMPPLSQQRRARCFMPLDGPCCCGTNPLHRMQTRAAPHRVLQRVRYQIRRILLWRVQIVPSGRPSRYLSLRQVWDLQNRWGARPQRLSLALRQMRCLPSPLNQQSAARFRLLDRRSQGRLSCLLLPDARFEGPVRSLLVRPLPPLPVQGLYAAARPLQVPSLPEASH